MSQPSKLDQCTPSVASEVARSEEAILEFWERHQIFAKSLQQNVGQEPYVFYDGPPFATGTPHYGHILASAIKDAVPRYQTMRGNYVERRWGWDTHGLPIEHLVEKKLGLSGKRQIEAYGVEGFNHTARSEVLRYVREWKKTVVRMGRWVDFDGAYKTMDNDYIESVWWAFGQLYAKGLVYEGTRVLPYCPRCETPVAQSEIAMDNSYRDLTDLSVYVALELVDEPGTFLVAWTTTPWTLPGNTALAVNPDAKYAAVRAKGQQYLIAQTRLDHVFPDPASYELQRTLLGSDLVGKRYRPPFDYFAHEPWPNADKAWKVYAGDFVTDVDGTGIVHIAPAFGEDDLRLAKANDIPIIWHVRNDGTFTKQVTDFAGQSVKPKDDHQSADVAVIKYLAAKGILLKKEKIVHAYPHCFRCETPLYYFAIPAWFINIQTAKPRLAELNEKIHWVPDHLKHGRFAKSMAGAPDWNISRTRYWATPLPIWTCPSTHITIVDSFARLKQLAGYVPADLHRPFIDDVTFNCPDCGAQATRIPEVFDCWFESASMPFAAVHYPFENQQWLTKHLPADFVAEYIAQTRTWFYYMHVLSVLLFDSIPFRHVVTTGNILAEDGQKMSKSKQNYPDPAIVIERYGVDALRHYLLSSPVMRAEDLNFNEHGVEEIFQKVILRVRNVLAFYRLHPNDTDVLMTVEPEHILDQWVLTQLAELTKAVTEALERYELEAALRPIGVFIDDLSVWYVRRSRERMRTRDGLLASRTLRHVLHELARLMAPFTPFVAEEIYQSVHDRHDPESVHLASWPIPGKVDDRLIVEMARVRTLVSMGLEARAIHGIKVRQPLRRATITGQPLGAAYVTLLQAELNVKAVVQQSGGEAGIELDLELDAELRTEGFVRELIRAIQQLRKQAHLTLGQSVLIVLPKDHPRTVDLAPYLRMIERQTSTTITLTDSLPTGISTTVEDMTIGLDDT
ncbi:isoleucine--tRNA ligase [Candidatus Berkelbacteria bacterium]|nr:isoleucine--tRNA ligase [Candidatus Berkelbacteria bacterium]